MTQFFEDFGSYSDGDFATVASGTWAVQNAPASPWTSEIVSGVSGAVGKALVLDDGTSDDRFVATYTPAGLVGDVEVYCRFKLGADSSSGVIPRPLGAMLVDDASDAGYLLQRTSSTTARTAITVGDWSSIGTLGTSSTFTVSADTWYKMRLGRDNTGASQTIRYKIWADGDTEPVDWMSDASSTANTGDLKPGLAHHKFEQIPITWDVIGIGTNGDAAPTEAEAGGTSIEVPVGILALDSDAPTAAFLGLVQPASGSMAFASDAPAAVLPGLPDITDVDTDEIVLAGQTDIAVTGTDLGTTNANRTFSLVQGATSVDQTETGTGTSTAATIDLVTENGADIKFGSATFRVTRTDTETDDIAVTVNPATGEIYVDITTPDSEADNRITAVPDIESGDQLHATGAGGGSIPAGLTINADATYEFSEGNDPAAFDVRVWDVNDSTWGAFASQGLSGEIDGVTGSLTLSGETPVITRFADPQATQITLTGQDIVLASASLPDGDSLSLSGKTPVVIPAILADAGELTIEGQTPTISRLISPAVGSIAFDSDIPIASIGETVKPDSDSLSFVGKVPTRTISNTTTRLTLTGKAPTVQSGALIVYPGNLPWGVSWGDSWGDAWGTGINALSLTGVAPTLGIGISATTGSLDVTGIMPNVGLTSPIAGPAVGELTLTGKAPQVSLGTTSLEPLVGNIVLSGQAPGVRFTVSPRTGTLALIGDIPEITSGQQSEPVPTLSLVASGHAPRARVENAGVSITNANATEISSNYEICDRSGFKVKSGELVHTWDGLMVRREDYEARHPQDFVRSVSETRKGSPRPEQEDINLEDAYPNGVSADDL